MLRLRFLLVACLLSFFLVAYAKPNGSSKGLLIVANSNDQTHRDGEGYLTLIDPATGTKVATVPDGGITAHELIVSPDSRLAYVPIYGTGNVGGVGTDGNSISVIDIASRKMVGSIGFPHGVRPHFGEFGPDGLLYVTTELDQSVSIVDPKTLKVIGSIPTGQSESHNVAISHDGRRGYTPNVYAGTVSVLDIKARKLITQISIDPPDPAAKKQWQVQRIAVSRDDSMVFTADWPKQDLVVIDTATNTIKARVPLPSPGYGTASTPDGRWLLVASENANKVTVIDLHTLKVVRNIDVPARPQEILMRPDGHEAYVSCDKDQKVAAIRISDWTADKIIDTGYYPDGLGWAALK